MQVGSGDFSPRDRDRIYGSPRPRLSRAVRIANRAKRRQLRVWLGDPPSTGTACSGAPIVWKGGFETEITTRRSYSPGGSRQASTCAGNLRRRSLVSSQPITGPPPRGHRESTRLHDCDRNIDSIRRPRRAPAKRDVLARAESCHDPGHRTRGEATRILRRTSVSRPSVCDDDVPAVADALLRSQLRGDAAAAPGGGSEEWYRPLQAGLRVATLTMRGSAEAAPHT